MRNGYFTIVGERGIRISGGQKQRIALARAIYNKSNILILDEATSALDKNNENKIILSLKNLLKNNHTIFAVSHKIYTLKDCDKIFFLEKGKILEKKYENLI